MGQLGDCVVVSFLNMFLMDRNVHVIMGKFYITVRSIRKIKRRRKQRREEEEEENTGEVKDYIVADYPHLLITR
jgi:hypothetical protein